MSLAVVYSRVNVGIRARLVEVEVHLMRSSFPGLTMVGLPEAVVKESKDRVRCAILNNQFEFPRKRITVNLAPADLPKEGGRYDLPIALGILAASGQISREALMDYEFGGELALTGELRAFEGALPMIIATRDAGRSVILPQKNAMEGNRVRDIAIFPASNLLEVCQHLQKTKPLIPVLYNESKEIMDADLDLSEVQGQYQGKRALEIAAAGGHSLLMYGPPGSGKTMLANRLIGILPEITEPEALEVAAINSLHGSKKNINTYFYQRPFRAPHHSASSAALVGGGKYPKPGEISLAHHGVLFLDELPEFNRVCLEGLREPLESGLVTISRAEYSIEYPARFQLIAAMNPCPCGYWGDGNQRCTCHSEQVKRYLKKLSGPFLDRIDLRVQMSPVNSELLLNIKPQQNITSKEVKLRVMQARQIQLERAGCLNSQMSNPLLMEHTQLNQYEHAFLLDAINKLGLSARAYHRLLQVSRTIADLNNIEKIQAEHLQEALLYNVRAGFQIDKTFP